MIENNVFEQGGHHSVATVENGRIVMNFRPSMMFATVLLLQFHHFVEIPNEFSVSIVQFRFVVDVGPKIPIRLGDRLVQEKS